jgi:uncharacterized damage-inducible protein DinB
MSHYILGNDPALPPLMSSLVDMLAYARHTTLHAVRNLTIAQLDHRHDARSNSIGALLMHMAAVEAWYQAETFEERDWTADEQARWQTAVELGPGAVEKISGNSLLHYVNTLEEVRARTLRELRARDDRWLLQRSRLGSTEANNHWKWFHVCEDELNHRGQIRWLVKRLPNF